MDLSVKRNTIGEPREPAETRGKTENTSGTVKMLNWSVFTVGRMVTVFGRECKGGDGPLSGNADHT